MSQRTPYLASDAEFSEDGRHRYWLSRRLSMGERALMVCGTNPSSAGKDRDDPTIRKAVGFARILGFDWLYMGNLHAYVSTDPKGLRGLDASTAIGPGNMEALRWMVAKADTVIAAWGGNPIHEQAIPVADWILNLPQCRAFGFTQDGHPKHPLYLPYTTPLVEVKRTEPARKETL